jgi:glycine oxidase
MFADYAARLFDETGIDIEYRTEGGLHVALDDDEAVKMEQRYRHQRELNLPVEKLSGDEVRALEPALSPEARCGLLFEGMHQVENRRLVEALVMAIDRQNGLLRIGDPVTGLIIKKNRVAGVTLPAERIGAGKVIIAAGAWSGVLNHLPDITLPVQPVRGQMLALDIRSKQPIHRVINGLGQYLVPRRNGRLLVGATVEKTGFDTRVTAGGIGHVLRQGIRMAPGLATAPILETWAGLRPMSKDGKPILGPMPLDHLLVATGHHRNGILLAPITAILMADYITSGEVPADMTPFLMERFVS